MLCRTDVLLRSTYAYAYARARSSEAGFQNYGTMVCGWRSVPGRVESGGSLERERAYALAREDV